MIDRLVLTFVFFVFWFLLSGKADFFHLSSGLFSAAFAACFALRKRSPLTRSEWQQLPLFILRFSVYCVWLLQRIILSAWHVSKIVFNPRLPIQPKFIRHKTFLKSDYEKALFGTSITLTPGTITIDYAGDELLIHQIDDDAAGDIVTQAMEKEIHKVFAPGEPT